MTRRPQNREEIHDKRQEDALADLEDLAHAGGILGGDARGAIAKMNRKLKAGREVDYAGLASASAWSLVLARLPLIVLCALILAGLAAKYLF
jgi:hypothetical protein